MPHEKNVTKNGVSFNIITTVRNIDDPADGVLGGNPNDTSPADYKLVEMSIICSNCIQQEPVILNTIIAPKNLEGASNNGALFINVFDANGQPVAGANLHVVNNFLNPILTIDDVTGNDGWLRIVDAPTSTLGYNITVTKPGYSTDYTVAPVKMPATVASQTVTEIYFSIDLLSTLHLQTVNPACTALGNIPFNLHGEKLINTNPSVYKYNQNLTTNGTGARDLPNMEWDRNYFLDFTGSGYDLAGASPVAPFTLSPNTEQTITAVLRPHVANSLLVKVLDSGTQLPLSAATVRLYNGSYDRTSATGLGYTRQTDWSGGSGQLSFIDETKYFFDSGTVNFDSPSGDVTLKKVVNRYLTSCLLESSIIDLGTTVDFNNIVWIPSAQPPETGLDPITFQIATSDTSTPATWDYLGPDGTAGTYYSVSNNMIWLGSDNNRYLRYKVFLQTTDDNFTPRLSEVAFTYTNSCTPPGQVFFNDLSAGTYTLEVSRAGYTTNSGLVDVAGNNEILVNLSVNE